MKSHSRDKTIHLLDKFETAGRTFSAGNPPDALRVDAECGVATIAGMPVRSLDRDVFTSTPRAIEAANGDVLLFYAVGSMHYAWTWTNGRITGCVMMMRRSKDRGRTWDPPVEVWKADYGVHGAILLRPGGGRRIYAFGTEPAVGHYEGGENAAIGFRYSDDDGHTWSAAQLIDPENAPGFRGMSCMRMDEGADGTWLVGSHSGTWVKDDCEVITQQFLLRSRDQGRTWRLLPDAKGWQTPGYPRMDEGRPIHLGDNRWLFIARTPEGHLWSIRSEDGGDTWSEWTSTGLLHLDAPPMVFFLADGRTLAAFIHNRRREGSPAHVFAHELRNELWVSLSKDEGRTWSEPRWLLANACESPQLHGWDGCSPMVSYADLYVDGENLHLFVDHQMRQVLQLSFHQSLLETLPTRKDLESLSVPA